MKTIYKYPLQLNEDTWISMPTGAKVLHVDVQNGKPCLWALVESENTPENRLFLIFGTGHEVRGSYIGTVQMGPYVWHIFEAL